MQHTKSRNVIADKWILSSAVQKSIRRGRVESAIDAALALHSVDPEYLPRRLPVIAFEDVGLGDFTICLDVLRVFGAQRFRASVSESHRRRLLAGLVSRLARAVKSRAGCDIFCLANADSGSAPAARFARSSESCLVALATDQGAEMKSRALALHLLSGMSIREGRWPRALSRFNERALTVVADRLEVPEIIGSLMVEGRHTAGLAAMLPLVWEAARAGELQVKEARWPIERSMYGLPPYAADMYTRIGRGVIAQFAATLRRRHARFFDGMDGVRNLPRLIGMAIFHAEGSKLDRWLENATLAGYREQIELIELANLGLANAKAQQELYGLLDQERRLLRQIRRSHMGAMFGEAGGSA